MAPRHAPLRTFPVCLAELRVRSSCKMMNRNWQCYLMNTTTLIGQTKASQALLSFSFNRVSLDALLFCAATSLGNAAVTHWPRQKQEPNTNCSSLKRVRGDSCQVQQSQDSLLWTHREASQVAEKSPTSVGACGRVFVFISS